MQFEIRIAKALEALEANLKEHVVELKEASDNWTTKTVKALGDLRDAVDRKGLEASYEEVNKLFYSRPKDNRAQYSKLIGALKLAQDSGQDTVKLDEDDYDRMFNDNWEWRTASKTANAAYRTH